MVGMTMTIAQPNNTVYASNIDWSIKKPLLRRALYTLFSRYGKVSLQLLVVGRYSCCRRCQFQWEGWCCYSTLNLTQFRRFQRSSGSRNHHSQKRRTQRTSFRCLWWRPSFDDCHSSSERDFLLWQGTESIVRTGKVRQNCEARWIIRSSESTSQAKDWTCHHNCASHYYWNGNCYVPPYLGGTSIAHFIRPRPTTRL